jgi:putative MATE family efflux protein
MKKSYEIDMTSGPLLGKILLFSIPLMLSGILQLLFNAADIIVVGRFAGSGALAAVGSTSSLINLLINVFVGLSVGVNVLVARYYGARKDKDVSETVHTAVTTSIVSGFILVVLGILLANPLLRLMGTPEDVLSQSVLYMRIYFLGMPVLMVYNFGAAILRAIGDTRRPLYFLFASGVVNVCLNLFFVVVLGMGVDGVAWATVISEHISAFLVLRSLMSAPGALKLDLKQLRIHPRKLKRIVKIGLPAGMQGAIFSISNVLIQSSVNSFGSIAMAGNTASSNIEGFVYTAMNAVYQTNLSFTSQNLGGRKYSRINKIMYICLGVVTAVGLILGLTAVAAGDGLLHSSDPEVLRYGMLRLEIICTTYFLCGIMDCMVGSLRGLGYSIIPMFVSLTGACGFRVLWVFTVFAAYRSLDVLYLSYPVSWAITAIAHMVTFHKIRRKIPKQDAVSM